MFSINYNGTTYYYVWDGFGNVVELISNAGLRRVTYTYDTWGNLIEVLGAAVGTYNPFRYKGYYCDIETGLYYLQSRYYDPYVGRFLNADGQLNDDESILGANLFAYCENNPVNLDDPCGHRPGQLFTRVDEVVMDFADIYNIISIRNNWEYTTFIYSIKVKRYISTKYYTVTLYSYYQPWTDKSNDSVTINASRNTKGYTLVAIAHTHAAYDSRYDNENFSGNNGDIGVAKYFKLNMYVVTPGGRIKRYTYSTKEIYTFSYRTYHDYRSKFNFIWRTHRCSKCAN